MKNLMIISFFMAMFSVTNAQDATVVGTWNIVEFTMTNENNVNKMTEDALIENKSIWDLNLMENGSLTQTSNMRTGETETQEGSWKTDAENLILTLKINDKDIHIEYGYELSGDNLTLKRTNPMGTMTIETKFRKKT